MDWNTILSSDVYSAPPSKSKPGGNGCFIAFVLLFAIFNLILLFSPIDPKEMQGLHPVIVTKDEGDSSYVVNRGKDVGGYGRVFYIPQNAADSAKHIKNLEWFGEFKHDTLILTRPEIGTNRTVTFIHDITFPKTILKRAAARQNKNNLRPFIMGR